MFEARFDECILPDLRAVSKYGEIYERFLLAARLIMLEHDLAFDCGGKRCLQITALELYLHSDDWPDPNTDKNREQQKSNTWYVRRRGANANSSRIDITAGHVSENVFCGLLIRGIDGMDGSGRAIKRILRGGGRTARSWSAEEIELLDEQIHGKRTYEGALRLIRRKEARSQVLLGKSRVGLRYPEFPWSQPLRIVVV